MLTLRFIQENRDFVIERLKIKNFNAAEIIDHILELDKKRRSTQTGMDENKAELNKFSKLQRVVLQPVPFEKTPTKKIKRFLYA